VTKVCPNCGFAVEVGLVEAHCPLCGWKGTDPITVASAEFEKHIDLLDKLQRLMKELHSKASFAIGSSVMKSGLLQPTQDNIPILAALTRDSCHAVFRVIVQRLVGVDAEVGDAEARRPKDIDAGTT